jgi:hypothetical protein
MNRRSLLVAAAAACLAPTAATAARTVRTRWIVRQSAGFDALYFMGPLAGDPMLAPAYAAELAAFKPRLPAEVISFLEMGDKMSKAKGAVLSAVLCKFFSMGPDATIDDLVGSLDAAETVLKPKLMASDDWGGDEYWATMMQVRPPLKGALVAMRDAGFEVFRDQLYAATFARRSAQLNGRLATLDVVPQVERLVGRPLEPTIEIVLNYFDYPRSQRLFGQRFITHHSYSDEIIFRVAGHELLHPPFDRTGPSFKAALEVLGTDPFVVRLVNERDPGVGSKGDLAGYVEECCTQALDQIVSERLGLKRSARAYWGEGDHMPDLLAASIYGLLKADGYDRQGGVFERWLGKAAGDGRLSPRSLRAAGTRVLGAPPEQVFKPFVPG